MKRSDLYKKLRDVAKAKITDLAYVDLQKQQMKKIADTNPIPLPALLIEFKDARFSNVAKLDQLGDKTISLYLYLDFVTDSFDGAESENDSIALLDKMDEIFQTFQGVSCELFSQLIRVSEGIQEYGTGYICFRTDFSTSVKDIKEVTKIRVTIPPININTSSNG